MTPSASVLVVDDDVEVRAAVAEVLDDEGFQVATAENGRVALDLLLAGSRPHVILLDVMMPVMDGRAFRAEQQKHPGIADIPVIIFTAYGSGRQVAEELRAAGCLEKPLSLQELVATARRFRPSPGIVPVPTRGSAVSTGAADVAAFIRKHRTEVLDEWQELVCRLPSAEGLSRPALLDHVPDLLGSVADIAEEIANGRAPEPPQSTAERHAIQRLDEGFDLAELVIEYSVLRDCILRRFHAENSDAAGLGGLTIINMAIDRAIAASADCYVRVRDRTLQALDRISEIALASQELEPLLHELLRVLVEATTAADTALILLRDGDVLRARAAVGLEADVARGFSIRVGEGFTGAIAAERQPKLLQAAASDALVQSKVIRDRGVRALYGVPLIDGDEVIGVAHIGSLSVSDFSEQDKRLLLAMAHRATAAVSQHMLRQKEQNAREEAQRALALLDAERRRLSAILEQLPAGVLVAEAPSGIITLSNRRAQEIIGRPLGETARVSVYDDWAVLDATGAKLRPEQLPLARAVQGEAVTGDELTIRRPTGEIITVRASAVPIRGGSGEVSGAVVAFDDITERKRAEEEQRFLKEATALLASSLEYRETLASIARLAVPALADWCAVEIVTPSGTEQLAVQHVDPDKIALARRLRERFPVDAEAAHGVPQVLRSGEPELYGEIPEQVLVARAQSPEHLALIRELGLRSAMIVPMIARGRIVGAVSFASAESGRRYDRRDLEIARELAARAALALDNARLYGDAQDAVRAREAILAVVSHDLKNPLATIHMSAALLLQRSEGADGRTRKQIETIQRSAGRMEHLIADLLDMASIHAGRLAVEKQLTESGPLLRDAIELAEPLAAKKGISIERPRDLGGGVRLQCDRNRVLQIFSNLLGNAVKFCHPGDRITLGAQARAGQLHVSVSDTGPGIASDELQHIFEPYWSGERYTKQGTGLGLFITKGIIEAHGGTISVESSVGAGTTFRFTLPLAAPSSS